MAFPTTTIFLTHAHWCAFLFIIINSTSNKKNSICQRLGIHHSEHTVSISAAVSGMLCVYCAVMISDYFKLYFIFLALQT